MLPRSAGERCGSSNPTPEAGWWIRSAHDLLLAAYTQSECSGAIALNLPRTGANREDLLLDDDGPGHVRMQGAEVGVHAGLPKREGKGIARVQGRRPEDPRCARHRVHLVVPVHPHDFVSARHCGHLRRKGERSDDDLGVARLNAAYNLARWRCRTGSRSGWCPTSSERCLGSSSSCRARLAD
jgi:hypothetical protein